MQLRFNDDEVRRGCYRIRRMGRIMRATRPSPAAAPLCSWKKAHLLPCMLQLRYFSAR